MSRVSGPHTRVFCLCVGYEWPQVALDRLRGIEPAEVLEEAGLVVTRRSGRQKLHFLNPVPIRLIHDRWIDKYTERRASALAELKTRLEESG